MHNQLRVLIVDDDEVDRLSYQRYLNKSAIEFEIINAHNSQDGLAYCAKNPPDCILVDYNLPDLNGLEFIKALQADPDKKNIPVIMFTGNGAEETAVKAMKAGAKDYINKSKISTELLTSCITNSILKSKLEIKQDYKQQKLHQLASEDELTGLLKRFAFEDRLKVLLEQATHNSTHIAVLFIDLDNFKPINDKYGHQKGDWLLKQVALKIKSIMRQGDLVCRYGGDEFIVTLNNISNHKQIDTVAKKIIHSISEIGCEIGFDVDVGASVGIATYPENGKNISQLIQCSDMAMYEAKRQKNHYAYYASSDHSNKKCNIDEVVNHCVMHNQVIPVYQPQIDIVNDSVTGFEAYLRVYDNNKQPVEPSKVISTAFGLNLLSQFAQQLYDKIFADVACCYSQYPQFNGTLTINTSVHELCIDNYATMLASFTKKYMLDNNKIALELREDVLSLLPQVIETINELKDLGFKIIINNFGSNSSTLQHIKIVQPNAISLDSSYFNNLDKHYNILMIAAIKALCESLNIEIIAKYIETEYQQKHLKKLGIKHCQGYLYAKPMSMEYLMAYIETK